MALLILPGQALAWDPASSLIRFNNTNGCLATDGKTIRLAKCNSNDTRQRWAYTASGELRSPRYENRCLDVDKRRLRNGTHLRLFPCRGFKSQQWTFTNKLAGTTAIKTAGNMCVDLRGGDLRVGTRFIIYSCQKRNANQKFNMSFAARQVVNSHRANLMGFDHYRACATHRAKDCFMGFGAHTLYKFGFYTGGKHGDQSWTSPTLDFGDALSVDYCAKIHDRMYAVDYSPKGIRLADMALVDCANRARPVTFEESEARKNVLHAFRLALKASIYRFEDEAVGRDQSRLKWHRARLTVDCYRFFRKRDKAGRNKVCTEMVKKFDQLGGSYEDRYKTVKASFDAPPPKPQPAPSAPSSPAIGVILGPAKQ